jgi:hypothetical protein
MESTLEKPVIKVSKVKELLASGYTRDAEHKNYNSEIGCLTDYYGLSSAQVNLIFGHVELKGIRTKTPKVEEFVFENDEATDQSTDQSSMEDNDIQDTQGSHGEMEGISGSMTESATQSENELI